MINRNLYKKAYKEVTEILRYIPKEEFDKIPSYIITNMDKEKDNDYNYQITHFDDFENQEMLTETKTILAVLYRDYWATKEEKSELDKILKENQEKLNELYDYSNMFKNVKTEEKVSVEIKKEQTEINNNLVEYKESIFSKIKKWLRNIFKRKYN